MHLLAQVNYSLAFHRKLCRSVLPTELPRLSEPSRIRTCDRLLRRQMLYPAELRVRTKPLKRIVLSCLSLTGPLRILLWLCREDRTRTCDPLVPNQMRYHLRHFPNLMQHFLAERLGLEPRGRFRDHSLAGCCITTLPPFR